MDFKKGAKIDGSCLRHPTSIFDRMLSTVYEKMQSRSTEPSSWCSSPALTLFALLVHTVYMNRPRDPQFFEFRAFDSISGGLCCAFPSLFSDGSIDTIVRYESPPNHMKP